MNLKDVSPEKFEEAPIIFGDFLKIGAAESDRMYEELTDMKKLFAVLSEVCKPILLIKNLLFDFVNTVS